MNILFWGKGHIFNCLMEYALWKKGCEITGIIESKKTGIILNMAVIQFLYMNRMKYNRYSMISLLFPMCICQSV